MNINEYVTEVLTVLKKDEKLEHLMGTVADDSALAPAKGTIEDIQKRVVTERIIQLTKDYFGEGVAHVDGEKLERKQGHFFLTRRFGKKKQNE